MCGLQGMHINVLEMRAVYPDLAAFLPQLSGQSVVLMSNNTSVVAYQDSTVSHDLQDSSLDQTAFGRSIAQVHSGEEEHSGGPARSSRPGSSHGVVPSFEGLQEDLWGVRASPSQSLCHPGQCQAPTIRVPSSGPDDFKAGCVPTSLGPSVRYSAYAFLPFALLKQALSRVLLSTGLSLVLVASLWPQKEWFTDLLSLLVDEPLELLQVWNLLVQPQVRKFHQGLGTL